MYKLLLCLRYLKTRYIALASVLSVTLGVATMIVVNSVMAGFSHEMRNRIQGLLSDIVIETNSLDGESDAIGHRNRVLKAAGQHIDGVAMTVEIYGMLHFPYAGAWVTRPVTLIGIDPESKAQVGPLRDYLGSFQPEREDGRIVKAAERDVGAQPDWSLTPEAGSYRREWYENEQRLREHALRQRQAAAAGNAANGNGEPSSEDPFDGFPADGDGAQQTAAIDPEEPLPARLYVGAGLISYNYEDPETGKVKTHSMVRPGDDVRISTATSTVASGTPQPVYFNATVVDVFKSGMSEYDSGFVFCNLEYLQKVRGMIDRESGVGSITSIQIKLKDFRDADMVVDKLRAAFPPGLYSVKTWEQKQGPLLAAVDVEASILNVLLFLIITVAGFGILAIFFMIVVEKTKDIGILKALGASSNGVMAIFLSYGFSLGITGAGAGAVAGLLFVRYINTIEKLLTFLTGRKVFDERIYYFPKIPTHVEPAMVLWVALGAMMIAVLASILPARRAAQLRPVEALRYE